MCDKGMRQQSLLKTGKTKTLGGLGLGIIVLVSNGRISQDVKVLADIQNLLTENPPDSRTWDRQTHSISHSIPSL